MWIRDTVRKHKATCCKFSSSMDRSWPARRTCSLTVPSRRYDTELSFLQRPIEHARGSTEPAPKKVRTSESTEQPASIAARLSQGAYSSLETLRKDAALVTQDLIASIRNRNQDQQSWNRGRLSVNELKQIQKIRAFEQLLGHVIEQETKYDAAHGQPPVVKQETTNMANAGSTGKALPGAKNRTVLTMFGNAPTPKQLFSSMQSSADGSTGPVAKSELPVEEMSLPTGLTATNIMPVPAAHPQTSPTFQDTFAPGYGLLPLNPPKSSRRAATRDTAITWEFKDQVSRNKDCGATVQSGTVGEWLHYGGVESKQAPPSPREKRKLRDRALSGGESSQPAVMNGLEDGLAKAEEALFRRAYSSFAPSMDDSKSTVPTELRNMMWWDKVGNHRYKQTLAIDPALLEPALADHNDGWVEVVDQTVDEETFQDAVEAFEGLGEAPEPAQAASTKTDIDQVLREVSRLLETLASHQRIRNATLGSSSSNARGPVSPAPTLAGRIGKPDEEEMATYYALQRELAYLILRLPPYAVAKLDGDQLSELGVRKLLTFEAPNLRGTMEDDQVARMARYTAMATAAGVSALTRPSSTSSQHYSSTSQRAPAIGQAANTRYGPSQFGAGRTPIAQAAQQYQRPTQPSYGTPTTGAPRPAGFGQYSRPNVAQQANGQQYHPQRPPVHATPGGYGGYSQRSYAPQSASQQQARPGGQRSQLPAAQWTPRPGANAVVYQTPHDIGPDCSGSPIRRPASAHQVRPQPQPLYQRPLGSGRSTPLVPPAQGPPQLNGSQQRPPAQAPPSAASVTYQHPQP